MTRLTRFLLLLLLAALLPAGPARAQVLSEPSVRHVPGEVLLKFRSFAKSDEKQRVLDALGARPAPDSMPRPDGGDPRLYRLAGLTVEEALERYGKDPALEYIEPNYIWTLAAVPDDPGFPDLWAMQNRGQDGGLAGADIGAVAAWDLAVDSRPVRVGIVDTGIDYLHEDLRENLWVNPGEIAGNGLDDDGNGYVDDVHGYDFAEDDGDPYDEHGHGTHVAGTIAAVGDNGTGVAGVNWGASLVALRALNAAGEGTTEAIVQAIEYGVAMGLEVLNNSYGSSQYSAALADAVTAAQHAGVVFVAAAGNSRMNIEYLPFYPASLLHPNIVSVAASDRRDELASTLAWGSNYGPVSVDLLAPGDEILSTLPGDAYGVTSGTSMAAPHVSGAVALLLSRRPYLSAVEAKQVLLESVTVLPQLEGTCVTGGRLWLPPLAAAADTTGPPPVTDLDAVRIDGDRLELGWTAIGDAGNGEPVASYQLRWSLEPLDETSWETATPVAGVPEPGLPGAAERLLVDGLQFETTYHFGIRAVDQYDNRGALGTAPALTTLGPPALVLDPDTVVAGLGSGARSTRTVQLRNDGAGTLSFAFGEPQLGAPDRSDGAGYVWTGSDDPDGPAYVWDEIVPFTELVLSGQDELVTGPFDLGFGFPFYDRVFDRIWISSNGFIAFAATAATALNRPLPSADAPSYLIAPFWADLDPGASGAVFLDARPDRVIVEYFSVYRRGTTLPHTFQVHLLPDGSIEFHYRTLGQPGAPVTVGMQGAAGGPGLQIVYDEDFLHDEQALRIEPIPSWLTVVPDSGEVPAGGALDLTLELDAADLCGLDFSAWAPLQTNDPAAGGAGLDVTLAVSGQPYLALETTALDFGVVAPGGSAQREIRLRNAGCATLVIDEIVTGIEALSVTPAALELAPGSGAILQAEYAPTRVELVTGRFLFLSNDPEAPLRELPFAAQAAEAPVLELQAVALDDTLRTGQRVVRDLVVANRGGSELAVVLATDADWIETLPDTLSVAIGRSDTVRVALDATGHCDEQLSAAIRLGSNDPLQPETTLPVSLLVESSSRLAVSPSELDWGGVYLGGTEVLELELANSGCEPLTILGLESSDAQFVAPDSARVLQPGESAPLAVGFAPAAVGPRSATLTLFSDDPDQPAFPVDLAGIGLEAPVLAVEPRLVSLAAAPGQLLTRELALRNDGSDTLRVTASAEAAWLRPEPGPVEIPAGESATLSFTADASGRCGEQAVDLVRLASNDPAAPETLVAVTLDVLLAPDVAVEPDTLSLPRLFVGQTAAVDLQVYNRGCLALVWDEPVLPDPDMTLSGDRIRLDPGSSREWTLSWTPTVAGELDGLLRLPSNDPDEPELTIVVRGEAIPPPSASVTASGLEATLLTGARSTGSIELRNDGWSDLVWSLTTEAGPAPQAESAQTVVARGRPLPAGDLARLEAEGVPLQRTVGREDVPDRLALRQEADPAKTAAGSETEETFGAMQFRYEGDNRSRGNVFHCTTATTLREHRLYLEAPTATQLWMLVYEGLEPNGGYDLVSASDLSPAGPAEGWFSSGQIDLPLQADRYYLLMASFSTTCGYYTAEGLAEYPVPASFGELILGAGYDWSPVTEFPPRDEQNVTGPFDRPVAYYQQVITGEGTAWMQIEQRGGVVAPGDAVELDVVLDATGLCGVDYPARVQLWTNDPLRPLLELPVDLTVTPAPDLVTSTDRIDFGLTYPGTPVERAFTLSNPGCGIVSGSLAVDGDPAFEADPSSFALEPGSQMDVTVILDPGATGIYAASLSISSDDPDQPLRSIELHGESRPAPVLVHHPAALVDTVDWGVQLTVPVQLTNTGGSDLEFEIAIDPLLPALEPAAGGQLDEEKQAAAGLGAILLMEADTGQRYFHQALENLGLFHIFVTSYVDLGYALSGAAAWNLVIVNNYADFPDIAAIEDMTAYVSSGRPLILADWVFGDYSNQAIATRLGVDFEANLYEPDNFVTRDPEYGLFTFPNRISAWNWTDNQGIRDGQIVTPTGGAKALAGYANYPGAATIVQNEARNALFNAFQPVNFNADDDGDGKLDIVELCENQILHMVHQLYWLKVEPDRGTIAPGETVELQVTYDGSRIFGGWLEAELRLLTNDPQLREARVPVTLGLEGVSPVGEEKLPRSFAMADASPNPFNPSTTLAFDLPRDAYVELKIYDVRGSLVATLLEEERPAGRHSVAWNGRDRFDRAVASGVYFSRITAGEWSATRRMTLLK